MRGRRPDVHTERLGQPCRGEVLDALGDVPHGMRPGFAGIENELLYEPTTTLLFGDAKDTMSKLLAELKALTV